MTSHVMKDELAKLMEHVSTLGARTDAMETRVVKRVADEMSARERDVAELRSRLAVIDARMEAHEAAAAPCDAEAKVQQLMEAACSEFQDRLQREVNRATSKAIDGIIAQLRSPRALAAKASVAPPEEVPGDDVWQVAVSNAIETNEIYKPLCELVYTLESKVERLTAAATQAKADAKLSSSTQKLDISKIRNEQTSVVNSIQLLETASQDTFEKVCALQNGLADEARMRHDKDREIIEKLGRGLAHLLQRLDTGVFPSDDLVDGCDGRGESQATTRSMEIGSVAGDDEAIFFQDAKDAARRTAVDSVSATPTSQSASPSAPNTSSPPAMDGTMQALMDGSRTLPQQPRPPAVVYHGGIARLASAPQMNALARHSLGSAQVPPRRASPNMSTGARRAIAHSPPGSPWVGQPVAAPANDRSISPTAFNPMSCSRSLSPTARQVMKGGAVVPTINMHQSALGSAGVPNISSPSTPTVLQASQALMQQQQPPSSRVAGTAQRTARKSTMTPPANARLSWSSRGRPSL